MKTKAKTLVLFSGGLDSRLAIKLLQEQGIEVEAVYFKLPFGGGCCNNSECVFNFSQTSRVKLHVIDCMLSPLFEEYLQIVHKPKNGRGVAMNPCKDCKIFMLKKAKELADKINADFLTTGEVLGQRPMSQTKKALLSIEKQANLENQILRPLSAQLLPETHAEKIHLINRNKFLDIQGRKRNSQLELAKKYKIKYPNPGGGCLLCEKSCSKKLKDMLRHKPLKKIQSEETQLLNIGRHFRINGKIILGRNEKENVQIEKLNKNLRWNVIIPINPGPTIIFEDLKDKESAEKLLQAYSSNDLDKRKHFEVYKI